VSCFRRDAVEWLALALAIGCRKGARAGDALASALARCAVAACPLIWGRSADAALLRGGLAPPSSVLTVLSLLADRLLLVRPLLSSSPSHPRSSLSSGPFVKHRHRARVEMVQLLRSFPGLGNPQSLQALPRKYALPKSLSPCLHTC
jgi:hypothetical protein